MACNWCKWETMKAKEPYKKAPSANTVAKITRAQGRASTWPNSDTMRTTAEPSPWRRCRAWGGRRRLSTSSQAAISKNTSAISTKGGRHCRWSAA